MGRRADPVVVVDGLVKRYGGRAVVDHVSFSVAAGCVLALLGPNGAGKTTTVECVEGFRTPDAGRVRVLGRDPRRERAAVTPHLGVMLQEGGAWPAATPRQMLALYAGLYPRPADPDALLQRLGLAPVAATRFRHLSGGQKQRLNLALALVGAPRVAVLDEPTAGMDPQVRQDTWALVRELRDGGAAVLLTTHLLDEAERLADVVAVIDRGRLLALDSPSALVAGGGRRLLVTTPAHLEAAALEAALATTVTADGAGRWLLDVGPEAISRVSAWFAEHDLPLTGITAAGGLEEVFLRLTGGESQPGPGVAEPEAGPAGAEPEP